MRLIQEGPRNAKIILVGEAPGATEQSTGRPFVGGAGNMLDRVLSSSGISRRSCFVTNVCHIQPPQNDFDWFYKPDNVKHLAAGVLQLKQDIEEIKPNLVIALGGVPLQVLTKKRGIDKWRGSILESTLVPGTKVIGTYHPAFIMRSYQSKVVSEFDLRRCRVEGASPQITLPEYEFYLDPDSETRSRVANEMYHAEWLAVDIECWMGDDGRWKLACVGFSDRAGRAMTIPTRTVEERQLCAWLLGGPSKKIFQNGQFDVSVLLDEGIDVVNWQWDTMYGHHALYPECASGGDEIASMSNKKRVSGGLAKGLAFQTSIYTRQPYYKDDSKIWKQTGDINIFWRYNALDVAVTREIKDVQEKELSEFGTLHIQNEAVWLTFALMSMTRRGIKVDLAVRDELDVETEAKIANLQSFLDDQAGRPINVKSPDVMWLLYDKLKLPKQYNKDTKKVTADKDAINYLAGRYPSPMLMTVLRIRELRDLKERYLNAVISTDGRMRCNFDVTGTRSGRLSSRASLDGSGTNLQTIPEPVRRMFVVDPGKVFVYADYSQAEAWVVAHLARCEQLIELFQDSSRDVHRENAARIFDCAVEQVTYEQRYLAKRVVHASNYGMHADRLAQIVNEDADATGIRLTPQQAQKLLDKYFYIYPEIREVFWKEVEQELRAALTLVTPYGRKRGFFGRYDEAMLREAYSYKPQGAVGDLCRYGLANCYHDIELARPELGVECLLTVHDSILVQCDEDKVEEVIKTMEQAMRIPMTVHGREFYVPVKFEVGHNWGKKKENNPLGLEER